MSTHMGAKGGCPSTFLNFFSILFLETATEIEPEVDISNRLSNQQANTPASTSTTTSDLCCPALGYRQMPPEPAFIGVSWIQTQVFTS